MKAEPDLLDIFTDFFVNTPSLEEILAFQIPEKQYQRMIELMDKRDNEDLTKDELDELNYALLIRRLVIAIKFEVRKRLEGDK